jgi:hypothetical protein
LARACSGKLTYLRASYCEAEEMTLAREGMAKRERGAAGCSVLPNRLSAAAATAHVTRRFTRMMNRLCRNRSRSGPNPMVIRRSWMSE